MENLKCLEEYLLTYQLYIQLYDNQQLIDCIIKIKQEAFSLLEKIDFIKEDKIKDLLFDLSDIQVSDIETTSKLIIISLEKINIHFDLNNDKLLVIEKEINKVCSMLKEIKCFEKTDFYFTILDKIQVLICTLAFKNSLMLNEKLSRFIADFDRLDDIETRRYLFEKINNP